MRNFIIEKMEKKMKEEEYGRRVWKFIILVLEVMCIILLVFGCMAFMDVISARAATPYIDGRTGEWVIAEISSQEDAIDITEAPPINEVSVAMNEVDAVGNRLTYLGEFKLTYYCPCRKCNGGPSIDRFGNPLEWGTIAVDPKVIPLHTKIVIDGYDAVFTALDTGGKWVQGNHIDVFVPVSHSEALKMPHGERRKVWRVQ